jgi:hypothetical protein
MREFTSRHERLIFTTRSLIMKTVSKQSLAVFAAALVCASGFAVAQAPAPQRDAPQPMPAPQREAPQAPQAQPQAQPPAQSGGADTQGYLNTEAMKEVCKEKFPKAADKIEANWKKASAEAPPATKQQTSSKEYKAELANKVKELKAVDPTQLQPSCENMAR